MEKDRKIIGILGHAQRLMKTSPGATITYLKKKCDEDPNLIKTTGFIEFVVKNHKSLLKFLNKEFQNAKSKKM
jgi:hypothetical protein